MKVEGVALPVLVGVGVGAVALVGIALVGRKVLAKASELAPYVNPASDKNLVYDGLIGGVGRAVTGEKDWNLGGWIWELTHPGEPDLRAPAGGYATPPYNPAPASDTAPYFAP